MNYPVQSVIASIEIKLLCITIIHCVPTGSVGQ